MKKLLRSTLWMMTLALVGFQLSSCEKENTQQAAASTNIQGLWVGTYSINGQTGLGMQFYAFTIKPDGTMVNESNYTGQQHFSVGPWSLKGDTLTCTYTTVYGYPQHIGITEIGTAFFNRTNNTLVGTWRNVPPLAGSGPFILTKVE